MCPSALLRRAGLLISFVWEKQFEERTLEEPANPLERDTRRRLPGDEEAVVHAARAAPAMDMSVRMTDCFRCCVVYSGALARARRYNNVMLSPARFNEWLLGARTAGRAEVIVAAVLSCLFLPGLPPRSDWSTSTISKTGLKALLKAPLFSSIKT